MNSLLQLRKFIFENYIRSLKENKIWAICFFNLVNVLISFLYALLGYQIKHIKPEATIPETPQEAALYGIGGRRLEPTEHEAAVTG